MQLEEIISIAVQHQELLGSAIALLTGSGATFQKFRRTGKLPLSSLPWKAARRFVYTARRHVPGLTKAWPKGKGVTVDATAQDVRERLGQASFNPRWLLSYNYFGEDYNGRLYVTDTSRAFPHRQIHVRGKELNDGSIELVAHEEPAPEHHPRAHLLERDLHDATEWVKQQWESDGNSATSSGSSSSTAESHGDSADFDPSTYSRS